MTEDRHLVTNGFQVSRVTRHVSLFAYATVLVAFFLRVYRLADKNIWWDEGWSVWLSQHDLAWIALRTAADEHPPLHYWMLHFWNFIAGTDAFAGRFLSVFFGVLTIALIYRIGKRVGEGNLAKVPKPSQGWIIGILAALFLAVARFHIWWSQDIKNYTPSIFFVFAAVWFALKVIASREAARQSPTPSWGLLRRDPSLRSGRLAMTIVGYALFAALALWTHYLAALVLLALNLYALFVFAASWREEIRNHKSEIVNWIIANALAAALFAPWLVLYLQNASAWSAAPAFDFGLFLKLVATVLPLGVTTNIENYAALTIALTAIAVLGGVGIFAPRRSHFSINGGEGRGALFALIVLFPPILIYLLSLTPVSFFAPKIQARYLLALVPAYVILLALGIAVLRRFSIWLALAATLFILGASMFVLNDYYADRRLRDDYTTLVNTINAIARPGDIVLLDTDQEWPTFLYYLRAPLDWLGASNGKPMDAGTADALVRRALNRNDAVWLVTIPDALATDPQRLLEARLARELGKQSERAIGDKRLALYASTPRDFVNVVPENFEPQFARAQTVNDNLELLGYDLPVREAYPGDTLRVVTYWNARSASEAKLNSQTMRVPAGERVRVQTDLAIPPETFGEFRITVDQIELARIAIEPRRILAPPATPSNRVDYRLGDAIHLVGYDLPVTHFRAGDSVPITLFWRADHSVEKNYTVFVHLVGDQFNSIQNNFLWGQADRLPRDGAYPTTAWRAGESVPDSYAVGIDPSAPPGKYKIELGMYDAATGARLGVEGGSDSIVIAEIEIAP